MSDLCTLIWCTLIGLFRSRAALEAEILVLPTPTQRAAAQIPEAWRQGNNR
jgi:hypothetical protein